jgi:sterol desaturase/sphingolipid hydroxylase (fatty acid hydroxylase superfamily)
MDILKHLQGRLASFELDILRLCIWFLLLSLLFIPLERLFAVHPQKIFRKGTLVDLGYYFLNGVLPKALLVLPLAAAAWMLRAVLPAPLLTWSADLPLAARLGAALVVGEIGYYWAHRWMHEIPLLWRIHSIHHNAEQIDWLVNTHAHPLDIVFTRLVSFVPMFALGLAQPMVGNKVDTVPMLIMLIGTTWGFFIHSNLRWRFGWLGLLLSTPAFHHWHHTRDEHVNKNYASMLPILDCIFGTWYMPKKRWPSRYGTDGPVASGLTGQLLQPFVGHAEETAP